jgi:negative regulator of flagellin synthesis FlgM
MKIGNSPSPDGSASTTKVEQRPAARKPEATVTTETARATATAPAASAQVAISNAAQIAASAASGGSDDGSFDAAKVQRITQAISEGKFTVNANAIADKLVSNAQELLSARANKH